MSIKSCVGMLLAAGSLFGCSEPSLTSISSAVTIDPLIGPERGVDTPVAGRAAADQRQTSVAYSGSGYLAVWKDMRGVTPGDKIFAARLDAAGKVQDVSGLDLGPGSWPSAVWDGTNYLVVYCSANTKVLGRRVKTDGTFADAAPFVITDGAAAGTFLDQCSASGNGTKTFATWQSHKFVVGTGNTDWAIHGARISGAAVQDATPIVVSAAAPKVKEFPRVAFGGGSWLVAWRDARDATPGVYAARLQDTTGTVLDPSGLFLSSAGGQPWPASDGTDFVVAGWSLTVARVASATGAVSLVTINDGSNTTTQASVAFANGTYQVIWGSVLSGNRLLSTGGALDGPKGVTLRNCSAGNDVQTPAIFAAGSGFYVTWQQFSPDLTPGGTGTSLDVLGSRHSIAGGLATPDGTSLANTANVESIVDLAGGGTNGWFAVWRDDRGAQPAMYGARLDASGRSLDPAGIALGTNNPPAVAFNGTHYLLAYSDATSVITRRVDPTNGQLLAPTTLATFPASFAAGPPVDVASDGSGWFAVWWQYSGNPARLRIAGARISAAGANLDPAGVNVDPTGTTATVGSLSAPQVTFGAGNYFAVWGVAGSTSRPLTGTRVNATNGAVLDAAPVTYVTQSSVAGSFLPFTVGYGGSSFVLLQRTGGTRVSPATGATLGTFSLPAIGSGGPPYRVGLGFDGSSLLALYDGDANGVTDRSVLGSRFHDDGTDLDATDFQVFPPPNPNQALLLAAGASGKFLVATERFDPNPAIASSRVKTRVVQSCGDGGCPSPSDAGVPGDDAAVIGPSDDALPIFCAPSASDAAVSDAGDASATPEPAAEAGAPEVPAIVDSGTTDAKDAGSTDASDGGTATADASDGGTATADASDAGAATTDASDAVATDATVAIDAGVTDVIVAIDADATEGADAAAAHDAGATDRAGDKAPDAPGGTGGGGCGCRAGGSGGGSWMVIALGLALVFARRRRSRRDEGSHPRPDVPSIWERLRKEGSR